MNKTEPLHASAEKVPSRTIGPTPDLERHLPADWWRSLFNSVYLKTDGDVVENAAATNSEVEAIIAATGVQPNDRLLDVCCGQGRHSLEFARRGFRHVTGVDRSRYLIRLARRRAKREGLSIAFHEGDARKFRIKDANFHWAMVLGNSFGYFDREEDDRSVLRAIRRALGAGGGLVLDIADGQWQRKHFEPRSWEWIDQNHLVCRERSLSRDESRLISREVVVHAERGVIVDQFYAERLYSRESIVELLQECGFDQCRIHDPIVGESTRQQDLGMMANRFLLTARSTRSESPSRVRAAKRVAVLLGDPRLPDTCKRNGQFNEEDFETIDKLKSALGELSAYSFTYHDNHTSMMNELRDKPPELALNFCDEGYHNDAFHELHVPAALDLLEIPYSGAGPATLGLCYNKSLVRAIAQSLEAPTPLETYFDPDDQSATLPSVLPALVKPNFGDSSVGITQKSVVHTAEELIGRLKEMRDEFPGAPLLIQEYLTGNEYSVGVVGNPGVGYQLLPILEVDYSRLESHLPRILGYESKWLPDSPYWTQLGYREADMAEDAARRLYDVSTLLFERLGCRDYARFDFRADNEGQIKLLEVNPNPGWCWDGKLNLMAGYAGLRYADLLRLIIEAALARCANRNQATR